MSAGYEAPCPSCGAPVAFTLGTTVVKVCAHCGSLAARKGVDLTTLGQVAQLIPTPTVLELGQKGSFPGGHGFELLGRLQVEWEQGTWDEWLIGFRNGSWSWLSEAQGRFHYLASAALPPVPAFSEVRAGQTVDLGPTGTFVVTDVRSARFASAQGELPFEAPPGATLHSVDLSGPNGQFATLDYGQGDAAEALYVGREVTLAEVGLRPVRAAERVTRAAAQNLKCPQCAGPLELRAPDATQRIACPYCGSLLDATKDLEVLEALDRVPIKPLLPLGSEGRLANATWMVIGFMERSVTAEGVRYPWREYLLYEPRQGFRWLVESDGHWSYVEPVSAGDVQTAGSAVSFGGERYQHFQGGIARVDHVLGEFYWAVARGNVNESADFVAPPFMLSREKDANEVNWSRGRYLTPREIQEAFKLPALPRDPLGVAPHQPNPVAGRVGAAWAATGLAGGVIFLMYLLLSATGGQRVLQEEVVLPDKAAPGSPEAVAFLGPFVVPSHGNLQIRINAPVDNSWLYLGGALINESTSEMEMDEFDLESSFYHGSDSDGAWSEGDRTASTYVGNVAPGKYTLRLAPQWDPAHRPAAYSVEVRSRVPRFHQVFLAFLALAAWPILLGMRHLSFESKRWSTSDHPWSDS